MKRALPIWLLCLVALAGNVRAQSLDLTRARLPGGGGVSAGGQFTLFSTVGQPESAARVAGGAFTLDSGFLGATLPSPVPTVYFPSGTVTVLEDSGAQTRVGYAAFEPGDAGPPVQPATYQLSNNSNALFSTQPAMDASRTLTFTPAANANGSATVTVVVRADGVDVATNTFAIVVTAVNDAPSVAFATNNLVVPKNAGPLSFAGFATFTAGPADEAAQTLAYTVTTDNAPLFATAPALAANGTLAFTTAAGAEGAATVTVVVQDSGGTANGGRNRATNTFMLTVLPFTANADAYTVAEDTTLTVSAVGGVLVNDVGLSMKAVLVSAPAQGSLTLNLNGSFTYLPATNFFGADSFTYVATNSTDTSAVTTVSLTVTPVNDAPSVTFAAGTVTVLEDAGAQSLGGFATFSPGPANESAQTLVGYTVTVNNAPLFSAAPAIANNGTLTFTPALNANGSATVTVVVQDSGGVADGGVDKSTNAFTIAVTAVNDAPVANNDSYTMSLGDVLIVAGPGVLANDTDVENDSLTASKLTNPAHGTVTLNANGGFTYTPAASFYGVDSFTYRAADASSSSAPATVSISVLARPVITPPPGKQRVFSSAALRFSATNAPDINAIRVSDPDSSQLTLTLTVTNGTLAVSVTNGLALPNGATNTNSMVMVGPIASLNAALESLAYRSTTNYFGDDTLVLVAQDEGGRTNRGNGAFDILVEVPARGASLEVPLQSLNNPGTGLTITNATAVSMDTNLVQGITFNPTNSTINVLQVSGQDGATNRSTITVLAQFNDGTTQLVTVPIIIYNPLLTSTTNLGTYNGTFGTPLFNPQTSLYEQKVSVRNNTPFDFTALRITATNLPATVTLQNATLTNSGRVYIDHNVAVTSGSNVTLKLEYFSSDLRPFTPGLKLELLNIARTTAAPTNAVMSAVAPRRGYAPDGLVKNYVQFPSRAGKIYYVQYQDLAGPVWKTSPVVITGTGFIVHWMDDGPPNTDTPPGPARFYRIVTDP